MPFQEKASAWLAQSRLLIADGVTIEEAYTIARGGVRLLVAAAAELGIDVDGAEKKALVMAALLRFLDGLIPALPSPWNWFAWFAKSAIAQVLSAMVEAAYRELIDDPA